MAAECDRSCGVHAICCCMVAQESGHAVMMPVSEHHPLQECRHFVAGTPNHTGIAQDTNDETGPLGMQILYDSLGVVILGTVVDGDCGPDAVCIMFGWPQTYERRCQLRHDVCEYLSEHAEEHWMQDILVQCQELHKDDVA